ncbi:MAG: hypothetical protein ABIM88_06265 [candidate division WOR-3 bacterium]
MKKLFVLFLLIVTGCFFGTFQTPEPTGSGKVDGQIFASFPGFVHPDHGKAAADENIYRSWNIGGAVGFGVAKEADIGVMMNGMGVGPYAKIRLLKSSKRPTRVMSFAVQPYLLYDIISETYLITPGVNLMLGYRPHKNWMWYLSWQGIYAPQGATSGEELWGEIAPGFYQHAAFGLDFKYKGSGEFVGLKGKTDYGFRLELGGSYFKYSGNGSYYPIFTIGLGFVGGSALGCLNLLGAGLGGMQ